MTLVLADGAEQRLDPATVTMAGPQDVYCRLENGHRARFLRDALAAMSPLLEERHGRVGLRIGDEFFEIVATKGE